MDRDEARRILDQTIASLANRGRSEWLARIGDPEVIAVTGPSGTTWQVELEARWDGAPGGTLRILASADDGSLFGAFRPVCMDFDVED